MSNFHSETKNNRSLSSNGEVDCVRCHTCDHVKGKKISIYFPPINSDTDELLKHSFFTVFLSLSRSLILSSFVYSFFVVWSPPITCKTEPFFGKYFIVGERKKLYFFWRFDKMKCAHRRSTGYSCGTINFDYRASGTIVLLFAYAYLLVIMFIAYKCGFVVGTLVCGLSRQVSGLFR